MFGRMISGAALSRIVLLLASIGVAAASGIARAESPSEQRWYFPGFAAQLGVTGEHPLPRPFEKLHAEMTPAEVAHVFASATQPERFDRGEGDYVWKSQVSHTLSEGEIEYELEYAREKGKLRLKSACIHYAQAMNGVAFHHDLVQALTNAFGKPSQVNGEAMSWSWGEIVDLENHYAYRAFLVPQAFLRAKLGPANPHP